MEKQPKETTYEVREIIKNSNNMSQKKYLASQKQLRVWMEAEKYTNFKALVTQRGKSIHRIINDFVDGYLRDEI